MSVYFLAPNPLLSGPEAPAPIRVPTLALESLDGSTRVPLDGSLGWWRMDGATGLEMPPVEVVTGSVPGVPGSQLYDVRVQQRPVFVPIYAEGVSHVAHLDMMDTLRQLVDPMTGTFRMVAVTERTEREMTVVYSEGLEGANGRTTQGLAWRKFGITAIACDPWAYDRADRLVEFEYVAPGAAPFIGAVGGTDAIWPTALASSAVIGLGMQVLVTSEVPVYPVLELVGPMDSFTGSLSPVLPGLPEWSVEIPGGVPAGSTLRLVTDPRSRSFRLGAGDPATDPGWAGTAVLAAGSVSLGSSLRPFFPGLNVLDVVAPGGTSATRIRLSWREAHRSLW